MTLNPFTDEDNIYKNDLEVEHNQTKRKIKKLKLKEKIILEREEKQMNRTTLTSIKLEMKSCAPRQCLTRHTRTCTSE